MKLHWSPRSPFVRKVMVFAHETGLVDRLSCMRTVVAMEAPNAALLPSNPLSKIPTLEWTTARRSTTPASFASISIPCTSRARLFPTEGPARWIALRRQALADGFLDFLLLWRHERERPQPSQSLLEAFTAKYQSHAEATGAATRRSSSATPFGIGHIAIGCSLHI